MTKTQAAVSPDAIPTCAMLIAGADALASWRIDENHQDICRRIYQAMRESSPYAAHAEATKRTR